MILVRRTQAGDHSHAAALGELDRVGHEVGKDLSQPRRVRKHRLRHRAVDFELQ